MNKVKAHTLRKYEEAKLVEELTLHRVSPPFKLHLQRGPNSLFVTVLIIFLFRCEQKRLAELRVSKVSSQPQVKLTAIKQVRKNIAKTMTVLSEKRIDTARNAFKKKRHTPVDLR